MKTIPTRFAAKCGKCHKAIPKGTTVWYDNLGAKGKKTFCHPNCTGEEKKTLEQESIPSHVHETFTFDSFLTRAETAQPSSIWATRALTRSQAPASSWSGGVDYEGILSLCKSGWPEGVQALEHAALDVPSTSRLKKTGWAYGVAGCRPLVPLAIAGSPTCMMQFSPRPEGKPVYRILAYLGNNASVNALLFYHWGLGLLALVDGIESSGVSVELVGRLETTKNDCSGVLDIELKTAGQPLDLDRLVTMVAHAGVTRRLFFRWLETHPGLYDLGYGYGRCPTAPPLFAPSFDLVLPPLQDFQAQAQTPADAIAFISTLYEQHVTFETA